ncbi:MAG TPA: hypothetical protein VI894_01905 [Candidatus Nanoarchaeia archaeon]|nr:hypothetical protein [Candidatus Nanoarchaeia archaeon]
MDNTKISKAKSERVDKQYYVDFSINLEEANNSIKTAEEFIAVNDFIAALTEERIKGYHEKAVSLFTEERKYNKKM